MTVRIYTERADYGRGDRLAIVIDAFDGSMSVAAPLTFVTTTPNAMPVWSLETGREASPINARELMQAFLDHAWELGMRPKGFADDTTEQVKAMKDHLNDLRAIVFEVEPAPIGVSTHGGSQHR